MLLRWDMFQNVPQVTLLMTLLWRIQITFKGQLASNGKKQDGELGKQPNVWETSKEERERDKPRTRETQRLTLSFLHHS